RGQFCRMLAYFHGTACCPVDVDPYIAALRPADLLQSIFECCEVSLAFLAALGSRHEHANASNVFLRPRREWPRRRAAEQSDEFASLHVLPGAVVTAYHIGRPRCASQQNWPQKCGRLAPESRLRRIDS